MIRLSFSLLLIGAFVLPIWSQTVPQTPYGFATSDPDWVRLMYEAVANGDKSETTLEAVREAYAHFHSNHPFEKTRHTQFYKRWVRQSDLKGHRRDVLGGVANRLSGAWSELGPWHYDPEVAMDFQVQSPGACHVYTVDQAASNHEVVWAGTATAGAWKSTDHGAHWNLMTRELPFGSVYAIAIHPEDPDRVWIGEGDGQLWRTTDGGDSWSVCGGSAFGSVDRWYRDLKIWPDSLGGHFLLAATNYGMWRSEDGGETMDYIGAGEFMELEAHPENAEVIYTVELVGNNTAFRKSLDGGQTFLTASESGGLGWPTTPTSEHEQRRCEISVTPANPSKIMVLASGSTPEGSGLYGIYVSDDEGATFSQTCCGDGPGGPWDAENNPNILGWSGDGTGDGGQFYYDLALGLSPTDSERAFAAGISVWRSLNGGGNWSLNGHWVTWSGEFTADRYTHADVHDIKFFERLDGTVDMWVASDGGLHHSGDQGDHMEPRMYGIQGTDFWGWQAGWRSPDVMVGGTYHNGTLIRNGDIYHWGAESDTAGGWLAELAGDNFRGFVNPADATRGYHDGGAFEFSDDRWTRIQGLAFDGDKKPNTSYFIGEYGNLEWDPRCSNCMYSPVGNSLWYSSNGGVSWIELHNFGGDKIISVKVSPRHPERIYVSHKNTGSNWRIHRSDDGGENWTNVSMNVAENGGNSNRPIYLEVDGDNPDRVWAILTGSQNGHKVFESQNAGESWQDLTTPTLEDQRVISIAHQRGTSGGLYLGTLGQVYFRDDVSMDWAIVGTSGLPVRTTHLFLQPNYCDGTLRSAGNRGVHEVDFVQPSAVRSGFMADRLEVNLASPCETPPVRFSEVAVAGCGDLTVEWSFPGGTPNTAAGPEVLVQYDTPGSYDVTCTVTDSAGNPDTWTWADMIQVVDDPVLPSGGFTEGFDGTQFPPENWRMETPGHPWEQAWDLWDAENGVAQFPNYWVDTEGAMDLLITPGFNPTGLDQVRFDVTYQTYGDYEDGLALWGKPSGADDWTTLWSAEGNNLAVSDCYTWFWYDTDGSPASETQVVPLPLEWTEGQVACLELAWVNIGDYGNHIWLDNIEVGQSQGLPAFDEQWMVYPNPSGGERITVTARPDEVELLDAKGQRVRIFQKENMDDGGLELNVSGLPGGLYYLRATGYPVLKYVRTNP
ncbi:MAG: PKD domain-containing protein [Flavobacteriales bacterium]